MTRQETLANAVMATMPLFTRFLAGFTDNNRTHQEPGMPGHAAWQCGHCALTMHHLGAVLDDGAFPPEDDFYPREVDHGDIHKFAHMMVRKDSVPVDDPNLYPTMDRAQAIFERACERLAAAARNASDARLDEEMDWGGTMFARHLLVHRVCFHNACHAGQLTDLRRMMGIPPIL